MSPRRRPSSSSSWLWFSNDQIMVVCHCQTVCLCIAMPNNSHTILFIINFMKADYSPKKPCRLYSKNRIYITAPPPPSSPTSTTNCCYARLKLMHTHKFCMHIKTKVCNSWCINGYMALEETKNHKIICLHQLHMIAALFWSYLFDITHTYAHIHMNARTHAILSIHSSNHTMFSKSPRDNILAHISPVCVCVCVVGWICCVIVTWNICCSHTSSSYQYKTIAYTYARTHVSFIITSIGHTTHTQKQHMCVMAMIVVHRCAS